MRLTQLGNQLALAATLMGAIGPLAGCHQTPYLEAKQEIPPATLEAVAAKRDDQVQAAQFLEPDLSNLPMPLPKLHDPRTTANPEAEEIWSMTLEEAIRIGLQNSEVVRVIALGAEGIPVNGFEPATLQLPGSAGGNIGGGTLTSVYDPAIEETNIASALSVFDAQLSTQLNMGHSTQPFNNAVNAGFFGGLDGVRFPVVFSQDTGQFVAQLTKRTATGALMGVTHNINYLYSNSPTNVYPSVYTTNVQLSFSQPLLGGQFNTFPGGNVQAAGYAGLEANRAPIVIARLEADQAVWRLKSEVMAMVRSIEQQYWALAQEYVGLWSARTAFDLSESLLEDVVANQEVGSKRGSRRDLADAQVQVEQARLNLVAATSDLLYTERQLRNILGLPPADSRRIVPVTEPTDARLDPNWDASLAQMVTFQPDIVQAQLLVRIAELNLLLARNLLLPQLNFDLLYQFNGLGDNLDTAQSVMTGSGLKAFDPIVQLMQRQAGLNSVPANYNNFQTWQVGFTFQMPIGFRGPLANTKAAQMQLLRQRAFLQQIVHQTTHALARFFLEVDANYKRYRAATRLKEAAWVRLDYNKARFDAGDRDPSQSEEAVTIRTLIDSINQWTDAIALEAQYKSTYNTSIAVLEEAKGTLLGYDNIAMDEGPWPRKAYVQARDQQAAHRQHPIGANGAHHPEPVRGAAVPDPVPAAPATEDSVREPIPALPFPVGPLGPQPRSAPPQVPAGEPNVLSGLPQLPAADVGFLRASTPPPAPASEGLPAQMFPDLPPQEPASGLALPELPVESGSGLVEPPAPEVVTPPAPSEPAVESLPELPPMNLPQLPG